MRNLTALALKGNHFNFTLYTKSWFISALIFILNTLSPALSKANQHEIDSLRSVLNGNIPDTSRIDILNQLALKYSPSNKDSARYFFERGIQAANQENDLRRQYKLTVNLSTFQRKNKQIADAIATANKALELTYEAKDKELEWKALTNLGIIYYSQREFEKTAFYFESGYEAIAPVSKKPNDIISAAVAAIRALLLSSGYDKAFEIILETKQIAENEKLSSENRGNYFESVRNYYYLIEEYDEAFPIAHRCIELRQEDGNNYRLIENYLYLGELYKKTDQNELAKENLLKGLELGEKSNISSFSASILSKLGYTYLEDKQYSLALNQFNKKLELTQALQDTSGMINTYCSIGEAYLMSGQPSKAKAELTKFKSMFKTNKDIFKYNKHQTMMAYETLAKVDSTLGNYKESLESYKMANRIKKDISKEATALKIEELEIKYQTKEKNKEIELLSAENEIQALASKQQRRFLWFVVGVTVLLTLLLIVLYSRYRFKKRSMRIIEEKSRENEVLVKEVHHRVKNNLQIMLSLLNTQLNLINDERAKFMVTESGNRIKSMALIHDNLYQSGNLVMVQAQSYFQELATNVADTFRDNEKDIKITTNAITEEIKMTLAVPVGLILNELITNSFKYAFEGVKNGELIINFTKINDSGGYHLQVIDNGRGLPSDVSISSVDSFGLRLVKGLTEQLNGSIEVGSGKGTQFDIYVNEGEME